LPHCVLLGRIARCAIFNIAAIERLLEMGVRAGQQALANRGLNYVIDEYLPRKRDTDGFLP